MKSKLWTILALLVVASMFIVQCAPVQPTPALPPPAEEEVSWWAKAAEPYAGVTIRGISESTPPSKYVSDVLAKQFEEETGIKVEFEVTSWDQMYDKAIKDMEAATGIYDFVYVEQDIVYSYLARDFLVNLTQMLKDNPGLVAAEFNLDDFTTFIDSFKDPETGDVYGVPMEAFVKIYLYRKDLFEDPEIQAAFKAEYGYDLAPATTFEQYADNAKFFTAYGEEQGLDLWGTTVQGASGHASSTYEFFETIAPSFGLYNWGIDMENWKATVENGGGMNSDLAKEALSFWLGMLEYAPPEATSSTWDEVAASFAAGRAAQGWVYGENASWIATDPERSAVVGNVGVALPPTGEGVMEAAEAGQGYIGYYDGGAFSVPHSSKNKEATLLWLQYIGQPAVQPAWAVAGARIVHQATFDDPLVKEADAKVDGYYTLLEEKGHLFAGAPPFPFHNAVRAVMDTFMWKAIAGELTPEDALDQMAAAVDEELARLGYGPGVAAPAAAAPEVGWWAKAAEPYAGVTIRGISESTPPSKYVSDVLAKQFEEETGIKVEFEVTSWDQMYDKAIKDMEAATGIYDFVYVEQDIVYSYLARDFLVNLTQMLKDNPGLVAAEFNLDDFTTFIDSFKDPETGDVYGVPMEAFVKIYLYRKDLFEDPEIQAAFKAEYGYDLAPATTFEQYADNAKFFTAYGEEQGLDLWGTTVQGASGHASSTYEFFETIAPSFGLYNWGIDMENWKATVENGGGMNSDLAKEALSFWLGMLEYAPPEATSSTWDEVAASFAAGRAAQGWVYGENASWIATDPERSAVVGNVGVALPPTGEGVMEAAEAGQGYIGYYDGGAFSVPHSSKNKEATLLWLQYIGQPAVQPAWAVAGARIVHQATFDDPLVKEADAKVDGYYTLLEEKGHLFAGAPPFPFHNAVRAVMDTFMWKAIAGELTPEDALDQMAAAVDEELVRLGYGQ